MKEPCTGCGKQTDDVNTVTVVRKQGLSLLEQQIGRRHNSSRTGKYGTVFVGGGLCDDCAGRVIESVRLMWTSQSLKAQGIG